VRVKKISTCYLKLPLRRASGVAVREKVPPNGVQAPCLPCLAWLARKGKDENIECDVWKINFNSASYEKHRKTAIELLQYLTHSIPIVNITISSNHRRCSSTKIPRRYIDEFPPPPKTATNITTLAAHLAHNQQLLPPRRQERPLAHLHDPLHALSIPFPAPLDIAIASQLAEPQTAVTREQPFLARERTRWVGPCGIDYGA
jgi:hypothetical protein